MRHARLPIASLSVALPALAVLSACRSEAPPAVDATVEAAVAAPAPGEATPAETTAGFRCGDLLLGATFDNTAGQVTLGIDTRRLVLPQAPAASGARYADGAGNEFWNKGDAATLTLDGTPQPDCATTTDVSPWDAARARGIVFRGLGTEPFWSVEVGSGDTPQLRAELDLGERIVVVPAASGTSSTPGFGGKAEDGSDVVLRIVDGDCSDGMSDQVYPARIELAVGGQTFTGCGAWLDR